MTKFMTIYPRWTLRQRTSNQHPTHGRRKHIPITRMNEAPTQLEKLQIRQQNMNRSLQATLDMLSRCAPDKYDLIAIQKPYIDFLGNAQAGSHWYLIYLKSHYSSTGTCTWLMILINKWIATETWEKIEIESPDVTGIKVKTQTGVIQIYNIYCNCSHSDSIMAINSYIDSQRQQNNNQPHNAQMIWLGDFNRHHPQWDKPQNSHLFTQANLDVAHTLIDAMEQYNLHMMLPEHIPTLQAFSTGNHMRTDNVFATTKLNNSVTTCKTVPEEQLIKTDHYPIDTEIVLTIKRAIENPKHNFWKVDWKEFQNYIKEIRAYQNTNWQVPTLFTENSKRSRQPSQKQLRNLYQ